MSTVTDHAEELCAYLNSNILGEELRLTHLLDALASCGLTLAPDIEGEASLAYISLIKRTFKL